MSLELSIQARAGKRFVPFLRKRIALAHRRIPHTALGELSLALVGDTRMAGLHKRFMNIHGPTDVLTFPLEFDPRGRVTSGEVVLCVPEALRQARARRIRVEHELLLYVLHGMLHLSGFDDRTDADHRRMHAMEDRILSDIGIGPTFMPQSQLQSTRKAASRRRAR